MAAGGFRGSVMGGSQAIALGWVAQDDVAVLEGQFGVGEHAPHGGPHRFDAVRRGGGDFVQEIGDVERPDVEDGAAMQRLAANHEGVAQTVAGLFVFEARGCAGDMGLGGLQEGQGAGGAAFGGVDAPGDLLGRCTGFLTRLGQSGGGKGSEPELLALAGEGVAIEPRTAQAAGAGADQHG